ncbi:MAG: type II secretion system F family protein [Rhodoluna sp.]
MRWFRSTVQGAGLAQYGPAVVAVSMLATAILAAVASAIGTHVNAFGFFVGTGLLALEFEFLSLIARKRRKELVQVWPEVVDSIHSAVASGLNLVEAFEELGRHGPFKVRSQFATLSLRLEAGCSIEEAIDQLKESFGELHADRLCELLRLVSTSGADSLGTALRMQSIQLRKDIAMFSEIESKQGWVSGTAKLAVAAPWVIVAMLSMRPENAAIYNSLQGATVMLIGFVVCVFAYRLVHFFGNLPMQSRVFL